VTTPEWRYFIYEYGFPLVVGKQDTLDKRITDSFIPILREGWPAGLAGGGIAALRLEAKRKSQHFPFFLEDAMSALTIYLAMHNVSGLFAEEGYRSKEDKAWFLKCPNFWFLVTLLGSNLATYKMSWFLGDYNLDDLGLAAFVHSTIKLGKKEASLRDLMERPWVWGGVSAPILANYIPVGDFTYYEELAWADDKGKWLSAPVYPVTAAVSAINEISDNRFLEGKTVFDYPWLESIGVTVAHAVESILQHDGVEQILLNTNITGFGSKNFFQQLRNGINRRDYLTLGLGMGLGAAGTVLFREQAYDFIEGLTKIELNRDGYVQLARDYIVGCGLGLNISSAGSMLRSGPRHDLWLNLKKRAAMLRRDYNAAADIQVERIIGVDGDVSGLYMGLADILARSGRFGMALQAYDDALKEGGGAPTALDFVLDGLYIKDIQRGLSRMWRGITQGTTSTEIQTSLEKLFEGREHDSVKIMKRVVELNPDNDEIRLFYAGMLDMLGRPSQEEYDTAIDLILSRPDLSFREISHSRNEVCVLDMDEFLEESIVIKRNMEYGPLAEEFETTQFFYDRIEGIAQPLGLRSHGGKHLMFLKHAGVETLYEHLLRTPYDERWPVMCRALQKLALVHECSLNDVDYLDLGLIDLLSEQPGYYLRRLNEIVFPHFEDAGEIIPDRARKLLIDNIPAIEDELSQIEDRPYKRDANLTNVRVSPSGDLIDVDFERKNRLPWLHDFIYQTEFPGVIEEQEGAAYNTTLEDYMAIYLFVRQYGKLTEFHSDRRAIHVVREMVAEELEEGKMFFNPASVISHLDLAAYRLRDMTYESGVEDFNYHWLMAYRRCEQLESPIKWKQDSYHNILEALKEIDMNMT